MENVQSYVRPLAYQLAVDVVTQCGEPIEKLSARDQTFKFTGSPETGTDVIYDF
jgi:hypothetical protein